MVIWPSLPRLAVLDAGVGERDTTEAAADCLLLHPPHRPRTRAELVDHRVQHRAADPARGWCRRRTGCAGRRRRGHGPGAGVLGVERGLEQALVGGNGVDVAEVPLDRSELGGRPDHAVAPAARVLEVEPQQVVVGELGAGREGVGVGARGDQTLVDAGVGVGHRVLGDGAARAAGPDRVADGAVPLDEPLLGHHQRLGVHRDAAVVPGVRQGGGDHREAAAQRGLVAGGHARGLLGQGAGVVGQPRIARGVRRPAVAAVRDEDLVVALALRLPRPPRLAGLEEGEDRVPVPVLVAVLAPDDERDRHALVGGRGRDVVGRRVGVVGLEAGLGGVGRLVEQRYAAAGCTARPERPAGSGSGRPGGREDRSAVGVVGDHQSPGATARRLAVSTLRPTLSPVSRPSYLPEARRANRPVTSRPLSRLAPPPCRPRRLAERDPGVTTRDEVGTVGDDRDHQRSRRPG